MKYISILIILVLINLSCDSTQSDTIIDRPSVGVSYQKSKSNIELSKLDLNKLIAGDIILRRGDGPLSYHLSNTTKEAFTHCGIIVKTDSVWQVIHSLGGQTSKQEIDGVQISTLKHFIDYAADSLLYICRPIFVDSANIKVTERAKYYLSQKIPFDHGFSALTPDDFYCSELLYHIFKDINNQKNVFVIKKKHKAYMLMFSTFYKVNNFQKIIEIKPQILVGEQ